MVLCYGSPRRQTHSRTKLRGCWPSLPHLHPWVVLPVVHTDRAHISGAHHCSWSWSGSQCCSRCPLQMGLGQGHTELPQQHCLSWQTGCSTTASEMPAGALAMATLSSHTSWLPVPPPQLFSFLGWEAVAKGCPGSATPPHCASLSEELHHHPKTNRFRAHTAASLHLLLPPEPSFLCEWVTTLHASGKQRLGLPQLQLSVCDRICCPRS